MDEEDLTVHEIDPQVRKWLCVKLRGYANVMLVGRKKDHVLEIAECVRSGYKLTHEAHYEILDILHLIFLAEAKGNGRRR